MKKTSIIVLLLSLLLGASAQDKRSFRGLCADDSLAVSGLFNPGRGFRLETAVNVMGDRERATEQLDKLAAMYASDKVSLSQSYFYLADALGHRLSEQDFLTMQTYFDRLKALGMKSVLRFAYEGDFMGRAAKGPTLRQALEHLDALKPFLEKNRDLILVVQAGVIGAWGEWHSSVHRLEESDTAKRAILTKLLEVIPAGKQLQVRIPEYKNLLKDAPELYRRLSFHDDFIVIKPDRWDGDMHEGTANFDQMVAEAPDLIVDGELPWGFWSVGNDPDSPSVGWLIRGSEVARRLFLQHYTSLSIIHNYKEHHSSHKFSILPEFSMIRWQKTPIDTAFLRENKMPFSAAYFCDSDGRRVDRSEFDYIRDHLGYRLELSELEYTKVMNRGVDYQLRLSLLNRGFSTVFDARDVSFVLIDESSEVIPFKIDSDCSQWQPYRPGDPNCTPLQHTIVCPMTLPAGLAPGKYRLGLWIADASPRLRLDPRYAVRCANSDVAWWCSGDNHYGINILAHVEVK